MKKIFVFLGIILLLSGCGKYNDKDLLKDLNKKINQTKAYHMTATLEIYRNEEKYVYDVDSSYKEGDNFKVTLVNKNNNHEQIILKNSEGVYVLTPSLNKCFKFQSDWPYNNSQIYLLQPILTDMNNDSKREYKKTSDGYIITSGVNYSSEKDFVKQNVYIDNEKNINKVEILDNSDNVKMKLTIIDINYKANFDDNYFEAKTYQKQIEEEKPLENKTEEKQNENKAGEKSSEDEVKGKQENQEKTQTEEKDTNSTVESSNKSETTTSKLDEIVYPMYVPADTYLSGQDIVTTSFGERVILTFTGESAFTVVQENLKDDKTTNYVYGDPYLILDTVGSITDSSVSWISNGVEYSIMSDTMNVDELLTVAQSIKVSAIAK